MAASRFEYNNPAGRLYQNLRAVLDLNRNPNMNQHPMENWAGALGVTAEWEAFFTAIIDMRRDLTLLEELVNEVKETNRSKYDLWFGKLENIKKTINSFYCNTSSNQCGITVADSALIALEFIAADIAKEEEITRDDLEHLRKLCDDLRNEIYQCKDLNKQIRKWLLDLVRLMRDGIDRYKVRGSKGMQKQFHEMLGSIIDHKDYAEETKQKNAPVWAQIVNGLEFMSKFSKYAESGGKAVGFVMKAIEQFPT